MIECPNCGKKHDEANHFCPITGQPIPLGQRMVGFTLLGRYEIISFLGPWFVGGTFKVRHKDGHGPYYVAKMVHPRYGRNTEDIALYMAGVERAMGVSHPNVARILEVGRDEAGAPIVIREYLDGIGLRALLDRATDGLEISEAAYLLEGVLLGVAALHKAHVKSGRMSPGDIFIVEGPAGEAVVKVTCFAEYLLEPLLEGQEGGSQETRLCKAPEQIREKVTEYASDLFSVGVIQYRMLTGKFPYPNGIPPKPTKVPAFVAVAELKPQLPSVVDYNLRRAMALFPKDRFKSASQFAETLNGFLPKEPVKFKDLARKVSMVPAVIHPKGLEPADQVAVAATTGRLMASTVRFEESPLSSPLAPASAATQVGGGPPVSQLEEAIVRHSSPGTPPATLNVPSAERPDAWKEERKLIPRVSRPPSIPPPPSTTAAVSADLSPEAVIPPPPVGVVGQFEKKDQVDFHIPMETPVTARRSYPPDQPLQEESLAPIMPSRHLKWFVLAAAVVVVVVGGWFAYSFLVKKEDGGDRHSGKVLAGKEKKEQDKAMGPGKWGGGEGLKEEVGEKSGAGVAAAAGPQGEGATTAGAVAGGGEAGQAPILEGLAVSKGGEAAGAVASEGERAKVEAGPPQKVTISLNVSPPNATVLIDGKKIKPPFRLIVDKGDKTYALRVEAKGYEPLEMAVLADESREIEVSLKKAEAPLPPPPTVGKGKGAGKDVAPSGEGGAAKAKVTKKKVEKTKKQTGIVEDVPF